tara:strand:+ start:421 stop:708 length:288 start_codon:yes stop_codon:yes gene_type:complete
MKSKTKQIQHIPSTKSGKEPKCWKCYGGRGPYPSYAYDDPLFCCGKDGKPTKRLTEEFKKYKMMKKEQSKIKRQKKTTKNKKEQTLFEYLSRSFL